MSPRARRDWASDVLVTSVATVSRFGTRSCRVCGERLAPGEEMMQYRWREELGASHARCGFYSLTADTWADREAIAAARALLKCAETNAPLSRELIDRAVIRGLARRVHAVGKKPEYRATPIGAALLSLLKRAAAQATADTKDGGSGDNHVVAPPFQPSQASAVAPAAGKGSR